MPQLRPSTARAYYERIRSATDQIVLLSGYVNPTEPFFEQEWIDFKGNPATDSDLKKIWSKALSGFANITDGLIIWGIDARKDPETGIDAASGLSLIPNPYTMESRLRDLIRDATNPPVMGVEISSYVDTNGNGFVVCFIPESSFKPHRAEFSNKHYYYRASDDFLVAEPGLLRVLFYPKSKARIEIEVKLSYTRNLVGKVWKSPLSFEVALGNTGTATAKDIYIVMSNTFRPKREVKLKAGSNWKSIEHGFGKHSLIATIPIHPGFATTVVHSLDWEPMSQRVEANLVFPIIGKCTCSFSVYCSDSEDVEYRCEFSDDDVTNNTLQKKCAIV